MKKSEVKIGMSVKVIGLPDQVFVVEDICKGLKGDRAKLSHNGDMVGWTEFFYLRKPTQKRRQHASS